jgi:hypothetical protein
MGTSYLSRPRELPFARWLHSEIRGFLRQPSRMSANSSHFVSNVELRVSSDMCHFDKEKIRFPFTPDEGREQVACEYFESLR